MCDYSWGPEEMTFRNKDRTSTEDSEVHRQQDINPSECRVATPTKKISLQLDKGSLSPSRGGTPETKLFKAASSLNIKPTDMGS